MLLLIGLCWTLSHTLVYLFPHYYFSELAISFLPYSIVGHIVFFALLVKILIDKKWTQKIKKIAFLTLLLITALWVNDISKYRTIYTDETANISSEEEKVSFLYANIYYKNEQFSWLLSIIESNKPDIIMFVEYAKIHDKVLVSLLKKEYPYRNVYMGGKNFDGDVIYSRYPLSLVEHSVERWSRSFSHVKVKNLKKDLDLVLVHTSAPVSPIFFEMRTQQIQKLTTILKEYYAEESSLTDRNIIVLGDFNISPWSAWYHTLDQAMQWLWLYNNSTNLQKTQYNNILFPYTRCHEIVTVFCSQIDHIRSNSNSIVLKNIDIPWSDHNGFIGSI